MNEWVGKKFRVSLCVCMWLTFQCIIISYKKNWWFDWLTDFNGQKTIFFAHNNNHNDNELARHKHTHTHTFDSIGNEWSKQNMIVVVVVVGEAKIL